MGESVWLPTSARRTLTDQPLLLAGLLLLLLLLSVQAAGVASAETEPSQDQLLQQEYGGVHSLGLRLLLLEQPVLRPLLPLPLVRPSLAQERPPEGRERGVGERCGGGDGEWGAKKTWKTRPRQTRARNPEHTTLHLLHTHAPLLSLHECMAAHGPIPSQATHRQA